MGARLLFAAVLLLWLEAGHAAFKTFNEIRAAGAVRIAVLAKDLDSASVAKARQFALEQGFAAELVVFERPPEMFRSLAAGTVDMIGSPVDRARSLPEELDFTVPVDLAKLRLNGRIGPVAVRFGSDEWHRALAMRAAGEQLPLAVISDAGEQRLPTRRSLELDAEGRGEILMDDLPRAWVVRGSDRVLRFKLNRFLHVSALREDARSRQVTPAPALLRANIRGALSDYDHLARDYARFYGFDWRLLLAVMDTESSFDPAAVSVSGALGLMQLKPLTAADVGIPDVSDPRDNVLAGARYLSWVRSQFEEELYPAERTWFALAAYNGGIARILEARRIAPSLGLDPCRWHGHVERAVAELGRRRADFDADQVIRYVHKVRTRLAAYFRVTEGPGPGAGQAAAMTAAP